MNVITLLMVKNLRTNTFHFPQIPSLFFFTESSEAAKSQKDWVKIMWYFTDPCGEILFSSASLQKEIRVKDQSEGLVLLDWKTQSLQTEVRGCRADNKLITWSHKPVFINKIAIAKVIQVNNSWQNNTILSGDVTSIWNLNSIDCLSTSFNVQYIPLFH